MKEEKNTKKISVDISIVVISIVLILILIADIIILITNKRNDERLEQITQNIIMQRDEVDTTVQNNNSNTAENETVENEVSEENLIVDEEK